jgi:hypothetical protein
VWSTVAAARKEYKRQNDYPDIVVIENIAKTSHNKSSAKSFSEA